MGLLIAGDLVPSRDDIPLFASGNIKELLSDKIFKIWNEEEHRIFNLEAPIINDGKSIIKCGPNIKIDEKCFLGIKKLSPSLVMLANNHIMDYGEEGLNNTISILHNNKVNYVGVGKNINEIKRYHTLTIDGKKVAIYNCAETEFSIATRTLAGAYDYSEGIVISDLINLKKNHDFVIVIYHGGKEHYRYPSPNLRKRCHTMTKNGADLVVCQHSHCIGCMENLDDNYIIYGQGNFLFNLDDNEYWNTSLLLKVTFDKKIHINYIPFARGNHGIFIPNDNERQVILDDFNKRSKEILQEGFVEEKYNELSDKLINDYLCALHGNNLLFRILNKLTNKKYLKLCYNKQTYAKILNYIECESHNELVINGLKNLIDNNKH